MKKILLWYLSNRATTAIEYSLIAGGIAVVIMAIVFTVGSDLATLFQSVGSVASTFTPS